MKNNELLLAALAQLEREGMVSIPQLAQLLDCSEEELFDALEILVFAYDAASIRLDLHDTYATLTESQHVQLLRLTPHEADVLIDALRQAGFSHEDELVKKLLETKSVPGGADAASSERVQTVEDGVRAPIAQVIAAACEDEEHHLVQISYRGENDTQAQERTVEPATIFSKEGRKYLLAYCHKAQDWRSFRIDRVKDAELLEECYAPRQDAPAAAELFMQGSTRALVRFLPGIPLPSWHGMHSIKTLDDGSHTARIDWVGSMWLPKHIVALTGNAIPLEPPELIEACKQFAGELIQG